MPLEVFHCPRVGPHPLAAFFPPTVRRRVAAIAFADGVRGPGGTILCATDAAERDPLHHLLCGLGRAGVPDEPSAEEAVAAYDAPDLWSEIALYLAAHDFIRKWESGRLGPLDAALGVG